MLGTNRIATIAIRSEGQWTPVVGATWICRIQPLSPTLVITNERLVQSTHLCIGEETPIIQEAMRLTISGENYYVQGSQRHNRPGTGEHHQEVWVARSE